MWRYTPLLLALVLGLPTWVYAKDSTWTGKAFASFSVRDPHDAFHTSSSGDTVAHPWDYEISIGIEESKNHLSFAGRLDFERDNGRRVVNQEHTLIYARPSFEAGVSIRSHEERDLYRAGVHLAKRFGPASLGCSRSYFSPLAADGAWMWRVGIGKPNYALFGTSVGLRASYEWNDERSRSDIYGEATIWKAESAAIILFVRYERIDDGAKAADSMQGKVRLDLAI